MTILFGLVISIILGSVCYFSTENIYSSIGIFLISLLYFSVFVKQKIKAKNIKIARFHNCYKFVNNFLISLSIKGHIAGALDSSLDSQEHEVSKMINELDTNDSLAKLKYLKKYFCFDVYFLFYDLVCLYDEQGGNILKMSDYLSNKIRETEDYIVNVERMHKDAIIEFTILWVFALIILIVLRFALIDFFDLIIHGVIYQISVAAILVFVIVSIHVAVTKICDVYIKGWDKNVR